MKSSASVSVLLSFSLVGFALAADSTANSTSSQQESPAVSAGDANSHSGSQFVIPGPRRSFLRMAGVSQKVTPEEVLPLVSRNVFTQGYVGTSQVTEFLILLRRYVVQARELASLAETTGGVLRVANCDQAGPLLRILGYRIRPDCGQPATALLTEDPERAFLAIDSGFPLTELEQALQGGKPFEYPYSSDPVPVLFAESDWTLLSKKNLKENSRDLLDTILNDSSVARLYWAFSRIDADTGRWLRREIGLQRLLPHAAILDFYGRELCLTDAGVRVPGGPHATAAWRELVGADPSSASSFVMKLLSKDKGWMAAYFDVLSRVGSKHQEYFTDSHRLPLFYNALRSADPAMLATRGSYRPAPWMLLLATRLPFDKSGEPLVPGGLEEWNEILLRGPDSKLVRRIERHNGPPKNADQLIALMFGLSRSPAESGPLQAYLDISDMESRRLPDHPLAPTTVRLLARRYSDFSDQYRIFSEFPELDDRSITLFVQTARGLNGVPAQDRGNAFGIFQANIGLWQILARQGQIPSGRLNESWQQVLQPFTGIHSGGQLYDVGRASLAELFRSTTGSPNITQDKIIQLLAGPTQSSPAGKQMLRESASRIRSVLDDQRLVSLDTILIVGDALVGKEHGKKPEDYVLLLAEQTKEFEMPRPIFSMGERDEWASGTYNNHHTDVQMKSDLPKVLKSANVSSRQIEDARGHLVSFLRDTLVGLNYAYYEPPGSQCLHNNPLLVRSHDFAGDTVSGINDLWQAPRLLGQGMPAGGGAHFVGSLADLPYVLAWLEQNFISPDNTQALVWEEVTPELLASSVLPRWWDVSPAELHAVALYQRAGEELLAGSVQDQKLRNKVISILSERMFPQKLRQLDRDLNVRPIGEVLGQIMPSDAFYLTVEFRQRYPESPAEVGSAMQELQELSRQHPEQMDSHRISRDFGIPHPVMAQNYGLELLNILPMPPFYGSANRLLAESWDSPNLYWARLADERGYSPVLLNRLVPELTRRMVEKVFATDFEDWPALLRAMRETGEEVRQGKIALPPTMSASSP
ncbi:MAG TPA: hypothetical protein VGS27_29505 [Candidatus Sulfotelmatobacter sp.]|nr:hypothetical protein [Candidatus Sulfotelmatobacter sp.]